MRTVINKKEMEKNYLVFYGIKKKGVNNYEFRYSTQNW